MGTGRNHRIRAIASEKGCGSGMPMDSPISTEAWAQVAGQRAASAIGPTVVLRPAFDEEEDKYAKYAQPGPDRFAEDFWADTFPKEAS